MQRKRDHALIDSGPVKLLLATRNPDKVREIKKALHDLNVLILTPDDIPGLPDVEEDRDTLLGNAIKKARILSQASGLPALADDTGLEVDALSGAPGVRSSRFSGENASYRDNVEKLLAVLRDIPLKKRTARFRCVIALALNDEVDTVDGICEGFITEKSHGTGGFGYDPIFYVPDEKCTFAEMTLERKNSISHRGRALKKSRRMIKEKLLNHGA